MKVKRKDKFDPPNGYGKCPHGSESGTGGQCCRCDKCMRARKKYHRENAKAFSALLRSFE